MFCLYNWKIIVVSVASEKSVVQNRLECNYTYCIPGPQHAAAADPNLALTQCTSLYRVQRCTLERQLPAVSRMQLSYIINGHPLFFSVLSFFGVLATGKLQLASV
jgi:hypothetical protein